MPRFPLLQFSPVVCGATLGIHVIRYQGGDYIAQGLALRDRDPFSLLCYDPLALLSDPPFLE